jgi:hypothetical protein
VRPDDVQPDQGLVGLLPRQPGGTRPLDGEPVGAGQRGDVRAHPRVQPRLGGEHVRRLGGQPLAQLEPGLGDSAASMSMFGHGRSGLT